MTLQLNPDTFRMAFDNATVFTAQALPTPTETPRQTPSRDSSRHGRRRRLSSPPSVPRNDKLQHDGKDEPIDANADKDMSPLDPRRFTPNLHASLVGQILTLQREVEYRNRTVWNLEEFLHMTKAENEELNREIKEKANEIRSIRKQMQLLEHTTSTALGDVAKERDDANEYLAEVRHCLETSKTKIRLKEEEAKNTRSIWDTERQNWDTEKRNMEKKVHLVESRLKTVLAEVAAAQVSGYGYSETSVEFEEGLQSTWDHQGSISRSSRSSSVKRQSRLSGQSNDTNEVSEYLNFRASTLSGLNGFGGNQTNGPSLADELNVSAVDEDEENEIGNDVMSPDALPEEAHFKFRRASAQSLSQDQKAWKLLGLLPAGVEHSIKGEGLTEKTASAMDNAGDSVERSIELGKAMLHTKESKVQYLDSATQFSPPSSPNLTPQSDLDLAQKVTEKAPVRPNLANKSRKRISAQLVEQTATAKPTCPLIAPMVSASCQTMERPLSPPLTPIIAIEPPASSLIPEQKIPAMTSSCTQTEDPAQAPLVSAGSRHKYSSMDIPFIEIHPPGSRPPSSHNSVALPPRTKNAGCQAFIEVPVFLRSISVQTDAVVPGKSIVESAPNIMPGTVSQLPLSKSGLENINHGFEAVRHQSSSKIPHRPQPNENLRPWIKPSHPAAAVVTNTGNNDSGSLSDEKATGMRLPVRNGSLFAGFDSPSAKHTQVLKDFDLSSDDDSAPVAPIRKTLSKVQNSWKLVPQSSDVLSGNLDSAKNRTEELETEEASDPWLASLVPVEELPQTNSKATPRKTRNKATASPDAATHLYARQAPRTITSSGPQVQRRDPSAQQIAKKDRIVVAPPPFPVPTRSSSRRIPISVSEGAQSPSPYSATFFSNTRQRGIGRPPSKNPLRKVRSAAAVPRFGRINGKPKAVPGSLSPLRPAFNIPQLPKMPKDDITSRYPSGTQEVRQTTHALPLNSLCGPASIDTPGQSTSVVDAIAQTMVGEWMWKYVRKRKSFGVTDDVDFDEKGNGNGIRHKRWVWLAPYERAVMWSSKQPTSGPALMGKNGRKRKLLDVSLAAASDHDPVTIQSVLDVKDDAAIPKNSSSQTCFERSILILTPQRALKFTATTRDRHYVWLTALSFLSHSPLDLDGLTTIPAMPHEEHQRPSSQHASGGLRRSTIRDSIRIAKLKERPSMRGHAYSSPISVLQHGRLESPKLPTLADDPDCDAAEPPAIPRTARKRSSTGPRPALPSSLHRFPAGAAMASTHVLRSPSIQDLSKFPTHGSDASAPMSAHGAIQNNPSQWDHDPMPPIPSSGLRNNFFDAVGTVRMEAFVEEKESMERERERRRQPPLGNSWAKGHSKKDLRYWGVGGELNNGMDGVMGAGMGMEDPFRGF